MDEQTGSLVRTLAGEVGARHVLTSDEDRRFYSQDISGPGHTAACVVQPATVDELAHVTAAVTTAGFTVVPRGGGASYTGGYHPDRSTSVVVDLHRLDRVVEVDTRDMYVTVECGCTWQSLLAALQRAQVRTPFWGPLSGSVATIGGSLSQHSILWGSARYGVSAESVIALDVVLADGAILSTGTGAVRTARPFFRYYGPDLTGLFLGDAGALGIKARATLKLIRQPACVDTASFGFDSRDDLVAAMTEIAREGLAADCFGMDPVLQYQRMKRAGIAKDLRALKGVVTSARRLTTGLKEAAKVAVAGRRFLEGVDYSLHLGTEGRDDATVAGAMREIRRIATACRGREVENTIPKVLRGDPFVPMTSAIGPEGERWLPVHGLVPLSDAAPAWAAIQAMLAEYESRFEEFGVVVGVLTAVVGAQAFALEPVFYWPAPRTEYYERVLDGPTRAKFKPFPPNPGGESLVFEVRNRLTQCFLERGAAHLQIGRTYRYREGLRPQAWRLLEALKRATDPQGLVNPGSLGLGALTDRPSERP